jgi:hypothetical protein
MLPLQLEFDEDIVSPPDDRRKLTIEEWYARGGTDDMLPKAPGPKLPMPGWRFLGVVTINMTIAMYLGHVMDTTDDPNVLAACFGGLFLLVALTPFLN